MHPLGRLRQRVLAVGDGIVHGAVVCALIIHGDGEGEISALACGGEDECGARCVVMVGGGRLLRSSSAAKSTQTSWVASRATHTPGGVPVLP